MKGREAGRVRHLPNGRRWLSIGATPLTGRERKGSAGEGRWTTRLTSGSRRAARERRVRRRPSRPQQRAVAQSGPQRSSSWAAELVHVRGWQAGPRGVRASASARSSRRVGCARQGRPGKGEGEEGRAGWVGPEGVFLPFFQIKCLSNSIFSIFIFKPNSNKF